MSTEEPAWKAELRKAVAPWAPYETKQPDDSDEYPEGLMATLLPHIQAAEERGRREALREAAEDLRDAIGRQDYEGENERSKSFVSGWRLAADHIDPDKETA